MQTNRRQFVIGCASSAAGMMLARASWGGFSGLRDDVKITRVVGFDLQSKRNKVAGKNAGLDVHGDSATDPMVRLYTNEKGMEGLGVCRASKEKLGELLGKSPLECLDLATRRMREPLGSQSMPMWDLVARMQNKQVCELLGASANAVRRAAVYDGSIYFTDLLPQHAGAWKDRLKREIDMGMELGHRAFKIKVGRGAKWMSRAEGDARDIEVVRTVREHAGKDAILGVDANNGYDLEGAKKFLDGVDGVHLAFVEEMFPEDVQQCLQLKDFMRARKWDTLLADGETQGQLEVFNPFIAVKAMDVLQGDMNRFGIEGIMTEAEMGRPQNILVAPHNWGSMVGFFQQLQVAPAIDNFYRAEHDPLSSDMLIAEGFSIQDGEATLPSASGFGLRIHEERFGSEARIKFDLRA